jgi:hypothetical protein
MSRPAIRWLAACLVAFVSACDTGAGRIDAACRSNDDCEATELCATGTCEDGLGQCVPVPMTCEDTVSYVCGCDGRTYDNDCLAAQARVRLQSSQACSCADNSQCVDEQICALDGSCSNVGRCLPKPDACDPTDTQQVCGCDGVTYQNACAASRAGARVSALGACECDTNADCATDELCNAITCDGPGSCETRPTSCPPPDDGPVIGCDGVEYGSKCIAAFEGIRTRP